MTQTQKKTVKVQGGKTSPNTPARRQGDKSKATKSIAPKKTKRLTLVELQSSLTALETRLKRADTLTRKSVKSLENVVTSLDTRTQRDDAAQKSALAHHIGTLSNRLESSMSSAREDIKQSLATALNNPDQKALEHALKAALVRLTETEAQQAKAIAKINRHLANLAKAVEERIVKDQEASAKALKDVETRLAAHIETVENDASAALSTIGEKVTELNDLIQNKQKRTEKIVALKISEFTQQTQSKYETQTENFEERLEKLELSQREATLIKQDSISEEMASSVTALTSQVETLDSRLEAMDASFTALQAQTEIMGQDLMKAQEQLEKYEISNLTTASQAPPPISIADTQHAQPENEDEQKIELKPSEAQEEYTPPLEQPPENRPASSPAVTAQAPNNIVGFAQQTPSRNPYADAPHMLTQVHTAEHAEAYTGEPRPSHVPVEFNPNNFTQTHTPYALQQAAATAFARPELMPHEQSPHEQPPRNLPQESITPSPLPQSYAPPVQNTPLSAPPLTGGVNVGNVDVETPNLASPLNYNDVESLPAGDPLLPYADPAYAEERMDAVRIVDDNQTKTKGLFKRKKKNKTEKKAKAPKAENRATSSLFTSRNLRVAALATGITLIGLFAAKTVLFGNETPLFESNDGSFIQDNEDIATNDIMSDAAPTIGEYQDNQIQPLSAGGADTLEAAAANGNAIAQFQLGLSNLEQGKTEEAVTLIRAASQTLPAAQYRLAKLYETGTGVEKNTEMAKDLTERAARSGNRIAMHDLAIYYAYGNGGVNVDMSTAAGWFEKAAERGVVDSQFNLAILFENGQGVKPSPADAYFWYSIAASQGDQTANARITALEGIMAPADVAAAKERASNFTPVTINQPANGIFKNLPWNKDNERRADQRRSQVLQVQSLLNDLGFDAGTADGIMGRKTRQAINSFERVNGLPETGQISDDLVNRLSVAAGA